MLTKTMAIVQVTFDDVEKWPLELRAAMGEILISCSQWEYVYELLWKDLKPDSSKKFEDKMREADSQIRWGGKLLLEALRQEGSNECLAIADIIENQLEARFRKVRDDKIHGFYHIYQRQFFVSRLSKHSPDVIGDELILESMKRDAASINKLVNEINSIRRKKFHS